MKKLLVFLFLVMTTISARAALFITNNTTCDLPIEVYAHDVNAPASCSYIVRFKVPAGTSQAYFDVTAFNNGGSGAYRWSKNVPGFPFTDMQPNGIWDAASIVGSGIIIGNSGTCGTDTVAPPYPGACNMVLNWTVVGGNILITN